MAARDEIIAFTTIVDTGTFSAAAEKLSITTAGVSRRIKTLEERLGIRLLNRTTRTATLTEAGKIYNERVRDLMASFDQVERELGSMSDSAIGELRVSVPMTFGVIALARYLPEFMAQYKDIRMIVDNDDKLIDVVADGYDLALRISKPHTTSLESTRLAPIGKHIYATPEYLEQNGRPENLDDLADHNCLIYSSSSTGKDGWELSNGQISKRVDVKGNFISNNGNMLIQAVRAHSGLALLPDFICKPDLDAGNLVRVLPEFGVENVWLYALYPSSKMMPPKVKVFLEFLEKYMPACAAGEILSK
jgi:DNA-binding transcriptional LysR family regulator